MYPGFNKYQLFIICTVALLVIITIPVVVAWLFTTLFIDSSVLSAKEQLGPDIQSEMQAIRDLHNRLDDDKDGQVDSEESEEFAREELLMAQSSEKCKTFHKEETLVSWEELWSKWLSSKARNWTCDQMNNWLKYVVEMPEVVPAFRARQITGQFLPLIAANSGQFLNFLNISKHLKAKLQIKAMDTVLFGPPPTLDSFWKDAVVILSVSVCVLGLVYAWRKQSLAHSKIDKFLEEIRDYESELRVLRTRLSLRQESTDSTDSSLKGDLISDPVAVPQTPPSTCDYNLESPLGVSSTQKASNDTGTTKESSGTSVASESTSSEPVGVPSSLLRDRSYSCTDAHENESMKMRIWELESQLEVNANNRIVLKSLLQDSCYREWSHLDSLRRKAEEDVVKAQKICDKIKSKRASVIGAFRLANSSALEDAGLKITRAVNKMHRISEDFHEYSTRWKKIEKTTHLSLSIVPFSSSSSIMGLASADSFITRSTQSVCSDSPRGMTRRGSKNFLNSQSPRPLSRYSDVSQSSDHVDHYDGPEDSSPQWQIGSSNETLEIIEEEKLGASPTTINIRAGSGVDPSGSKNNCATPSKLHRKTQSDQSLSNKKQSSRLNGFRKSLKMKN